MNGTSHPVSFSADHPDRELNRLTSSFRIFTVIPIAIVLGRGSRLGLAVELQQRCRGNGDCRGWCRLSTATET